ncbi:hypothetical protein AGLY_014247 [Aphis glycines]|uniref:Uncharacterized protein n=1 Tax=Aphis glycines TaxID=307491 RepID=A0A6G0T3W4_APHGL|nr:hypothetical protein AGLY_014247 [Aphis glycines]
MILDIYVYSIGFDSDQIYGKFCIKFSALTGFYKSFYELYLQNNLQIFMILTHFCQYLNFKSYLIKKIMLMYSYNFWITIRLIYEDLCIKFSSILTKYKYEIFYEFSTKKLLVSFRDFDIYLLRKNSCFPSLFLFFSIILKTIGKYLLLTSIMHQEYSLCHRKSPLKFEIEALFRQVMLYRHKKNQHTSLYRINILAKYRLSISYSLTMYQIKLITTLRPPRFTHQRPDQIAGYRNFKFCTEVP